jgi:hypothetical protein
MVLERTKDEIVIRIPASVDLTELQNMLDYLRYKEIAEESVAKQTDAEELSRMVNGAMWRKVKTTRGLK